MEKRFKKVAFLALRDGAGNFTVRLPVYVDMNDVDKQAIEESQQEIMSNVSSAITDHFEKQIAEFIAQKKKEGKNAITK